MKKRQLKKKARQKTDKLPPYHKHECPTCGWDSLDYPELGTIKETHHYWFGKERLETYTCPLCKTTFGYWDSN